MDKLLRRLRSLNFPDWTAPLALLALCLLSYGVLIPWLGYYWDDWAFVWISQKLGSEGLARYFATNRPVWGMLYRLTTPLIGAAPWKWHLFALTWRWLCAVALWRLVRSLWKGADEAALAASLLFVIYPGFDQQFIAITYGHFWVVLTAFFVSLELMLRAARRARFAWGLVLAGMALSAFNLFSMEYFFLLDLLRPVLLWMVFSESLPHLGERLKKTALAWLPFLAVFLAAGIWRAFLFPYQTQNYETVLLDQLKTQPLQGLIHLVQAAAKDIWTAVFQAWSLPFRLPDAAVLGGRTFQLYAGLMALTAVGFVLYLLFRRDLNDPDAPARPAWAWQALPLGLLAALIAGGPFWLTGLQVGLIYPGSRFTLPFLLGACLLLAGLWRLLPLPTWLRLSLLGLLLSLSVGYQFQVGSAYRREWNTQKNLFWQLAWRMPALKPGTTLLANDMPFRFCSDNSLTSPTNYIFAPDNHSENMSLMLYFPSVRLNRGLKELTGGLTIEQNYLASTFTGSTSQVVSIYFQPPACARVLDPALEPDNWMVPQLMREAAHLSTTDPILAQGNAAPPAEIFGAEPAHAWCYYYEKADLARQQGQWDVVVSLGEQAFALNDYPNDPSERFPFIEGYAHTGDWQRALELTRESFAITDQMRPGLCRLWQRIGDETSVDDRQSAALDEAHALLNCAALPAAAPEQQP
jgi:hypothetical protein